MNTGKTTSGHVAAVIALGGLAGCSGGGDAGSADTGGPSVSFSTSGSAAAESGGVTTVTVRLSAPGAGTADAVTVDVVDAASGTATSGTDYAAFAPQRVTFPAGSANGATQDVALSCLADNLVEGDTNDEEDIFVQSPMSFYTNK